MEPHFDVSIGKGRGAVRLVLDALGRDLLLRITGGEAHVGAVAVAVPADAGRSAPRVRDLVAGRHREGPLARAAAERICLASGCSVAVVAGIHYDGATRAEIDVIVENVDRGVSRMVERLGEDPRGAT